MRPKPAKNAKSASLPGQLDLFGIATPGWCEPKLPCAAAPRRRDLGAANPSTRAPVPAQTPTMPKPGVALAATPKRQMRQPLASGADGRLLDVGSAARYLGLSASTLNKLRCRGGGPKFLKITRTAVRYDPNDLDAWIAARRRESTSESS